MPAPVLNTIADAFRLENHTQVHQRIKILWQAEGVQHLGNHQGVSAVVFLVPFHDVGCHVPIRFLCVGADCREGGQSLESKLTHEPRVLVAVCGKWFATMPDIPVMGISLFLSIGIFKRRVGGW